MRRNLLFLSRSCLGNPRLGLGCMRFFLNEPFFNWKKPGDTTLPLPPLCIFLHTQKKHGFFSQAHAMMWR